MTREAISRSLLAFSISSFEIRHGPTPNCPQNGDPKTI
jgi:hypothetical protein